jgi:hypothetical protein
MQLLSDGVCTADAEPNIYPPLLSPFAGFLIIFPPSTCIGAWSYFEIYPFMVLAILKEPQNRVENVLPVFT